MPPISNNFFGIKVSKSGIPVQNASDNQLVYKDNFSTKTYYDESNARIVEGLLPDGTYGMWVSKPGDDVTNPSAAANNELVFNSNQDIFKIVGTGNATIPSITLANNASNASGIVVNHNLGYAPITQMYVQLSVTVWTGSTTATVLSNISLPLSGSTVGVAQLVSAGSLTSFELYFAVDTANVYITAIYTAGSSGATTLALPIKYYLLQETAN